MKKVFAALAASAVAVSMLAFTGCGGNKDKGGDGVISGNYQDVTDEELGEILDGIFGGGSGEGEGSEGEGEGEGGSNLLASSGYGLSGNFSYDMAMGSVQSSNASGSFDLKVKLGEAGPTGAGWAKYNSKDVVSYGDQYSSTSTVSFDGEAYLSNFVLYALGKGTQSYKEVANGETDEGSSKLDGNVKIDINEIIKDLAGSSSSSNSGTFSATAADVSEDKEPSLLDTLKEYGLKLTVDNKGNGVKFKLSATEKTVWIVAGMVLEGLGDAGIMEDIVEDVTVADLQEAVKFNTFKLDAYLAIDGEGAITAASLDVDISVKIDLSKFIGGDSSDVSKASQADEVPAVTLNLKAAVKLYTHSNDVTIPADLASKTYYDVTEEAGYYVGMIYNYAKGYLGGLLG